MDQTADLHTPAPATGPLPSGGIGRLLGTASGVDFWGRRLVALAVGAIVLAVGIVGVVVAGVEFDTELGGGETYTVAADLSRDEVFDALADAGVGSGAEVALSRSIPGEAPAVTIRLGHEFDDKTADVRDALAAAAGVDTEDVALDRTGRAWSEDAGRRVILLGAISAAVAAFIVMVVLGWRAALAGLVAAAGAVAAIGAVLVVLGVTVGERHLQAAAAVAVLGLFVTTLVFGQVRANRTRFKDAGLGSEDLYNVSTNQALPPVVALLATTALIVVAATVAGFVSGAGAVTGLGLVVLVGIAAAGCFGTYVAVAVAGLLGDNAAAVEGVDHAMRGDELRRLVAGGQATLTSLTGRKRAAGRAATRGGDADGAAPGIDLGRPAPVPANASTEQLLSHPARPRKKKRH